VDVCVGDLVKIKPAVDSTLRPILGIVIKTEFAWPEDEYDETKTVHVLTEEREVSDWYDFQVEVISEAR
tara:strand:- start:707 stop:913 length:207 start_codon:yes stop_codon:yes gene_type:complete